MPLLFLAVLLMAAPARGEVTCKPSPFVPQTSCRSSGGGSYVIKPRTFVPGYHVRGTDDNGKPIDLTCTPSVFIQETTCK